MPTIEELELEVQKWQKLQTQNEATIKRLEEMIQAAQMEQAGNSPAIQALQAKLASTEAELRKTRSQVANLVQRHKRATGSQVIELRNSTQRLESVVAEGQRVLEQNRLKWI